VQNQPPYTTPNALNVSPEAVGELRHRGGVRGGLSKAFAFQMGHVTLGRAIRMITTVQHVSNNVLKTRIVASAGGNTHYELDDGTFSSSLPVGGLLDPTVTISSTQLVHAIDAFQKLYVADWDPTAAASAADRRPKVFDPAAGAGGLSILTATAGTIPLGCMAIARYRGRLVLAGALSNPHQRYMSKVGVFTDFDYASTSPLGAVTGTLAPAFALGEPITALITTGDECLVFGCPTSLWILRGDPKSAGGHIDNLSEEVGIVSHGAWCRTPENAIVFLSHDGLYMSYGGCDDRARPQSLSRERIPTDLLNVNRSTKIVNMAYDTFRRGVRIFIVPTDFSAGSAWFFDWENKAFWPESYPAAMQPTAIHARRDFPSDQSVVLLGGTDGYVRWNRTNQTTDDGTAIASYLWYGPLGFGRGFTESRVDELHATLANNSGNVDWTLYAGSGPEEALDGSHIDYRTGPWSQDRHTYHQNPRISGSDFMLKLSSSSAIWSLERIGMLIAEHQGRVRR
jgi:hypothetical protein